MFKRQIYEKNEKSSSLSIKNGKKAIGIAFFPFGVCLVLIFLKQRQ